MNLSKRNGIYYIFYINPKTGKKTCKSTGEQYKAQAVKIYNNFKTGLNRIEELGYTPIAIKKAIWEYLKYSESIHTYSTTRDIKSTLKFFVEFCGDVELDKINQNTIQRYLLNRVTISAHTANKNLRYLKTFFKYAIDNNYIDENPCNRIKKYRNPEKLPLFLTNEDFEKLLSVTASEDLRDFFTFAIYTGMRRNEIINLTWRQINLQAGIIVLDNISHKTKSGKVRSLPIGKTVMRVLIKRETFSSSQYVFTYNNDKIKPDYATHIFKKMAKRAGLNPAFHFHHFRHTTASWLVQKGATLYEVQHILGHSSAAITQIYSHMQIDSLTSAINRLEKEEVKTEIKEEEILIPVVDWEPALN